MTSTLTDEARRHLAQAIGAAKAAGLKVPIEVLDWGYSLGMPRRTLITEEGSAR